MKVLVAIFAGLFVINRADALSLPLEGYFHPGRAMPVKWDVGDSGSDFAISAPRAITTRVHPADNPWGVFPWIVFAPDSGAISRQSLGPLQPLEESDLLVINTIAQDIDSDSLFPNRRVVTVHLQPEDLTGPAMAWETADAILLTSDSFEKIPIAMRCALFAEGVEVAVLDDQPPDARLSWIRTGEWWTASVGVNLPPIICPDAYAPTFGWAPGRSTGFRRQIVLLGVAYCLVILGLSLIRSRWMPVGIVVASILAGGIFALSNRRESPIFAQSGIVRLSGPASIEDDWLYQVSHREVPFTLSLSGSVQPVFYDDSQARSSELILDCDQTGRPMSLSGMVVADEPLTLMRRRFAPGEESQPLTSPATSPLRLLAVESIYPGFRIAGEQATTDTWPTVVLAQNGPPTTQP